MKNKLVIVVSISLFLLFAQVGVYAVSLNLKTYENNENFPPDKPLIIVPDKIPRGKWFKVEVEITDPDGDDIYLRFDAPIFPGLPSIWIGPLSSPINYESWINYRGPVGQYTIGVQAKDIYEAESDWTYVQFNITKSKAVNLNHNIQYQIFNQKFSFFVFLFELFI